MDSDGLQVDDGPDDDGRVVGAKQGDDVLVKSTCFAVEDRVRICEDPAEDEGDTGCFVVVVGVTEFLEECWSGVADDRSERPGVVADDLGEAEDGERDVVTISQRLEKWDHPDGDGTVTGKEPNVNVLTDELEDTEGVLLHVEKTEEHLEEARGCGGVWARLEPRRNGCVDRLEKQS